MSEPIGMLRFDNPSALDAIGSTRYIPTGKSGQPQAVQSGTSSDLLAGCLELSGVNLVDAMSQLIAAQRAYQISARVVQTSDEVEQVVNGLRR